MMIHVHSQFRSANTHTHTHTHTHLLLFENNYHLALHGKLVRGGKTISLLQKEFL